MKEQLKFTVAMIVVALIDWGFAWLLVAGLRTDTIKELIAGGSIMDAAGSIFGLLFLLAAVSFMTLLLIGLVWDWILNWVDIFQGKPPSSTIV